MASLAQKTTGRKRNQTQRLLMIVVVTNLKWYRWLWSHSPPPVTTTLLASLSLLSRSWVQLGLSSLLWPFTSSTGCLLPEGTTNRDLQVLLNPTQTPLRHWPLLMPSLCKLRLSDFVHSDSIFLVIYTSTYAKLVTFVCGLRIHLILFIQIRYSS